MVKDLFSGKDYEPNMLEMRGSAGGRYGMLWEPGHRMHCWIHYWHADGKWVSLRMGLPHEIENAARLVERREALAGVPCRA